MVTDIHILLKSVGSAKCRITVGDQIQELIVGQESLVHISCQGQGTRTLSIEHHGKTDSDPTTALIVEQIKFNEITSPRFVYQGVYTPNYPKHLLDSNAGSTLQQNYLSWNGTWTLDFTLPIYTWIHKVEDLGWIYD